MRRATLLNTAVVDRVAQKHEGFDKKSVATVAEKGIDTAAIELQMQDLKHAYEIKAVH